MAWRTLFWRDVLLVGSLLSATTTLTALVLLARGQSAGLVLAVHLLPLPYSLFMVTSLWSTPHSPSAASATQSRQSPDKPVPQPEEPDTEQGFGEGRTMVA